MSEPHKITSTLPSSANAHAKGEPFAMRDEDGIVHEVQTLAHPVYGGHNNILEEDIDVTLCDYEAATGWPRVEEPITCIRCLGFS